MKETLFYWIFAAFLVLFVLDVIFVVISQMGNNTATHMFINGRQGNRSFRYRALVYGKKKTTWYLYSTANDKYLAVRPPDDKRLTDILSCVDAVRHGSAQNLKVLNEELATKSPGVFITGTNILHM